jgi:glutaredoxin-related protein
MGFFSGFLTAIKYLIVMGIVVYAIRKAGLMTTCIDVLYEAGQSCVFEVSSFTPGPKSVTKDASMYSAILVKSDSCPFCTKQMEILDKYGSKAYERIKVLDSEKDAAKIQEIVGDFSSVPTWFNPITGEKTSGVKTVNELINMGVLF